MKSNPFQKIIFAISSLFVLTALLFLNSCTDSREFFTKEYRIAPDNFSVQGDTLLVPAFVDFTLGPAGVEAEFSHPVSYTLTITGLESGAEKKISGLSQNLLESWNGDHDGLYFFKAGEYALVELSFLGSNKVVRDTILIAGVKKIGSQGLALASTATLEGFEGNSFSFNSSLWSYGIYPDPPQEIDVAQFGVGATTRRDTMDPTKGERPVQGQYALTLVGKDVNKNYFVGGIKRQLTANERSALSSISPNDLYVNIYLYGRGDANSKLNYSFNEYEGVTASDVYENQFTLDHIGWKLFSIKYSDLSVIDAGNGIREPAKIKDIAFNLISAPPGNSVRATFDYPILTFGAPFNPNK